MSVFVTEPCQDVSTDKKGIVLWRNLVETTAEGDSRARSKLEMIALIKLSNDVGRDGCIPGGEEED